MASAARPRVGDLGEWGLIRLIRKTFPPAGRDVLVPIGDDAAWLKTAKRVLLTKDLLVEGQDFPPGLHPPRLLGRKSLNVNLSDIAAMGGRPRHALLGLGLPAETPVAWVRAFLAGFKEAAVEAEVDLAGGDLSTAPLVVISVTVMGEADTVVTRGGAKPGDIICVSGTLGEAAAGLRLLLEGGLGRKGRGRGRLLKRFLDPEPRLALGQALARRRLASAMIDVSDGLSVDLGHLCEESGTGAVIELARLPVSRELSRAFPNPWPLALHGGEEFELLFTVPPAKLGAVLRLGKTFPLTPIGIMARGRDILAVDPDSRCHPLRAQGFEHFRPARGSSGRGARAAGRRRR